MERKWILTTALMAGCVCFMFSTNALGGDSWKRHVHNHSKEPITARVVSDKGNVWFEGCANSENGPCKIEPGASMQITYTTTGGITMGTFHISGYNFSECTMEYRGFEYTNPPKFGQTNWCKGVKAVTISGDSPDRGDVTITDP